MALSASERKVRERCTAKYTATIQDESGTALASTDLTTLTLTLYDLASETILNSRNRQNVLNANNVIIDVAGVLTWTMQPADNVLVDTTAKQERHVALFEWTWDSGGKAGKYEVKIDVENLKKVP